MQLVYLCNSCATAVAAYAAPPSSMSSISFSVSSLLGGILFSCRTPVANLLGAAATNSCAAATAAGLAPPKSALAASGPPVAGAADDEAPPAGDGVAAAAPELCHCCMIACASAAGSVLTRVPSGVTLGGNLMPGVRCEGPAAAAEGAAVAAAGAVGVDEDWWLADADGVAPIKFACIRHNDRHSHAQDKLPINSRTGPASALLPSVPED